MVMFDKGGDSHAGDFGNDDDDADRDGAMTTCKSLIMPWLTNRIKNVI